MQENTVDIKFKGTHYKVGLRNGLGFQALKMQGEKNPIQYDCRKADCGICIIRVLNGRENLSEPTKPEADFLKAMHAMDDERLACQCRIFGNVDVEVEF